MTSWLVCAPGDISDEQRLRMALMVRKGSAVCATHFDADTGAIVVQCLASTETEPSSTSGYLFDEEAYYVVDADGDYRYVGNISPVELPKA